MCCCQLLGDLLVQLLSTRLSRQMPGWETFRPVADIKVIEVNIIRVALFQGSDTQVRTQ